MLGVFSWCKILAKTDIQLEITYIQLHITVTDFHAGSAEASPFNNRRQRGGRSVQKQEVQDNGCMRVNGRELADMKEKMSVDELCMQETRWNGSKPGVPWCRW